MTNIVDVPGTKAQDELSNTMLGRACVIRYSSHVLKVVLAWGICVQPPMKVLGDERIIGKIAMLATHAIDLGRLAGTQRFVGIETPDPFSKPWRRKISLQPGMHPLKLFALSKNALLQSVTRLSSASMSLSTDPPRMLPCSA